MLSTNKSHTVPPGMNLLALMLILAALAVAFGCWVDDEVHRHTHEAAAVFSLLGQTVSAHSNVRTVTHDVAAWGDVNAGSSVSVSG